jgi:amino acid permease
MFEALVIIFWFLVFYLAHKLYYEHKLNMMRKKWDIGKRKQEELNDLAFNSWYNR